MNKNKAEVSEIIFDKNDSIESKQIGGEKELTPIELLRLQYPKGTMICCIEMKDPYHPIPSGMMGKVEYIDDAKTIHMCWENGSSLGLIIGVDVFKKVEEPIK